MRESKRKAFNFFKSYFDVYNELSDKDKIKFMDALLNRQFFGEEPTGLTVMSNFAYLSQKHNIDSQVKGFEDKTKTSLKSNENNPNIGGAVGGSVQEKGKGKGKVQHVNRELKFLSLFNELKSNKYGKSNFKVLSKTDKNNLKQLSNYTLKDFKTVISVMLGSEWAKNTGNQTPTHVLRVENFNRYLSQGNTLAAETDEERNIRLTKEAQSQ